MPARNRKQIRLRAIRPSAALGLKYERRMLKLVKAMQASVRAGLRAEYRKQESAIVMDAAPWSRLQKTLKALAERWIALFEKESKKIAAWFADASDRHVKNALKAAVRDGHLLDFMTVDFRYRSARERDMLRAVMEGNVNLIKTIPQKYFADLTESVARSVESGRDLAALVKDIDRLGEVTHRRAVMIAKDQNEKAMSALSRVRFLEMGVTKAVWVHTPAGKTWRHTHAGVMDGKTFDLREGLYDPDPKVRRKIQPGELVNCRCVCQAVIEPPRLLRGSREP